MGSSLKTHLHVRPKVAPLESAINNAYYKRQVSTATLRYARFIRFAAFAVKTKK